jgi:16S rRNA (cytidine1402-2'-O)-methyltransferase
VATLYLVSTPIGNLGDLTVRAGQLLGAVDRVLAEDTRRSRILLDHLGLRTPLVSLHAHNEAGRIDTVLGWLGAGESLALVSDAGTPLVSDPGDRLVPAVIAAGHEVVPIPGASAILAALVGSGLPCVPFSFLGFVPRKGRERGALLERVAGATDTVVLFESPERLLSLLADLRPGCGDARRVAVARELTKRHEEFFRGTLADAEAYYREKGVRGEICLVVAPAEALERSPEADAEAAEALARSLLERGESPSRVAREVATRLSIPRSVAYRIVHELPREEGEDPDA